MSAKETTSAETADTPQKRPRVRDRIFDTACDLFYQQGIRAVGIDAITTEADTNKMSFYRSFSSKDELVAEYLRAQVREYWEWWEGVCAQHPDDTHQQAIDLFTAFRDKKCADDNRGCALGNAAVELCDDSHPGRAVISAYQHEKRERWRALAREMGAQQPDILGDALLMLQDGGHQTRLTFCGQEGPVSNIVEAARMLISKALQASG